MNRLLLILFCLFFTACSHPAVADTAAPGTKPKNTLEFTGKVVKVNLEGGFCGLVADDGRHFEPINLPKEFCQDGLPVKVTGDLVTKGVSVRMWGFQLHIDHIERR